MQVLPAFGGKKTAETASILMKHLWARFRERTGHWMASMSPFRDLMNSGLIQPKLKVITSLITETWAELGRRCIKPLAARPCCLLISQLLIWAWPSHQTKTPLHKIKRIVIARSLSTLVQLKATHCPNRKVHWLWLETQSFRRWASSIKR